MTASPSSAPSSLANHHARKRAARPLDSAARALRLAALAACALGACAGRSRRTPDDTIVVLVEAAFRNIDPRYTLSNHDTKVSRLVCPGLMSVDNDALEPRPDLAASLRQLDPLTWEAVLRDDIRFPDGSPVTSADVVYTFESTLDPGLSSVYRKSWSERLAAIDAVDSRTVRFHLRQSVATFPSDLEYGIVSRAAALAAGGRFGDGRVVGAGRYQVASYDAERILLTRNEHSPQPARTSRLLFRVIRDANARILMQVGGSADFAQNSVRLDLLDEVVARPRLQVVSAPSAILSYLMMENDDPILRDVRVRRAIAYAIDRERIIKVRFHGRAVLATGLLSPGFWAYSGDVTRYGYDPARARALLDEAGYPDPDGPGGKPRMRLTYKTSADAFRISIARTIAEQLGEVGIAVEVRSFEFGTFFEDVKRGNYQLASMQTSEIAEPDFLYTYFHSARIPTPQDKDLNNRWRYRNARVDELTAAARQESDRARRITMYAEVQTILADEVPIVPLWHEDNVAVMNVDLTGFVVYPNARLRGLADVVKK